MNRDKLWREHYKKLNINGVTVRVVDSRVLMLYEEHEYQFWLKVPDTNWHFRIPETFEQMLVAAGHNPGLIDPAVPTPWQRNYEKEHGEWPPAACWSYEKNTLFGEPLFISAIREKIAEKVQAVWMQELFVEE